MSGPTFVSYFCGPGYAEEAQGLRESLESFSLRHVIEEIEDSGAWVSNCAAKPRFIRTMRERLAGPLVWLDADARVLRLPVLFGALDCDVAGHYHHGHELLSSALYFGDTPAAREVLDAWCTAQERDLRVWDQKVLQAVLRAGPETWRQVELPAQYAAIWDAGILEPVILQRQASRRLRRRAVG